ncbi:MAG TPA: hypothetical protein VMI72_02185, partial [Roseiarcus sp.]|nr:hypothetical protein [Roseiarcus sp.]
MAECVVANLIAWSEDRPPLTPVPETPWRGRWGAEADAAGGGQRRAADRSLIVGGVVEVMKSLWDLPADCNEGELFAYAKTLVDRIEAGESQERLRASLADIQIGNWEMSPRDAYKDIVDRSIALIRTSDPERRGPA